MSKCNCRCHDCGDNEDTIMKDFTEIHTRIMNFLALNKQANLDSNRPAWGPARKRILTAVSGLLLEIVST